MNFSNISYSVPDMHIATLDFSLLIVRPKPAFFKWIKENLESQPNSIAIEEIYYPEEDPVFLIPPLGKFHSHEAIQEFYDNLKPKILKFMCVQFIADTKYLPKTYSSEIFDSYFRIEIKDKAFSFDFLDKFKN